MVQRGDGSAGDGKAGLPELTCADFIKLPCPPPTFPDLDLGSGGSGPPGCTARAVGVRPPGTAHGDLSELPGTGLVAEQAEGGREAGRELPSRGHGGEVMGEEVLEEGKRTAAPAGHGQRGEWLSYS